MRKFLMVLLISFVSIQCGNASEFFKLRGYFEHNKNRIKTIELPDSKINDALKNQAFKYGKNSVSTSSRLTAIYFYPFKSRIPNEQLTHAKGVFSANEILYEGKDYSKWVFVYMKAINGTEYLLTAEKNLKIFYADNEKISKRKSN